MSQQVGAANEMPDTTLEWIERGLVPNALQGLEGRLQMALAVVASQQNAYTTREQPDLIFDALWNELDGIRVALRELRCIAARAVALQLAETAA